MDLGIARGLIAVDGPKSNGRVERRIALVSEGAKAAFVEFPNQFYDVTFPARTKSYAAIWPETFTWMNDCLNITAAVHNDDKRCPEETLYGKRRVKQAWPFMMPGFRHRNRPTKMHDKGERCFYLNSGNDHSSNTHKVITPAGIATYCAHCTFGYRRQAFQGEVSTWGGGCYYLFAVVAVYGVFTGSGTGSVGSDDIFTRRGYSRRDTGGVSSSTWGGIPPMSPSGAAAAAAGASWIYSRGEGFLPSFSSARAPAASAAPRGGGISPMSSPGAAATSAAAATSSRGRGIPAAVPAAATSAAAATSSRGGDIPAAVPAAEVTGGTHVNGIGVGPPAVVGASPTPPASDPSVGAGAATGELLATEQEQEQLVASGGRIEILAEVSRMAGGTSPMGPGALPAALPALIAASKQRRRARN